MRGEFPLHFFYIAGLGRAHPPLCMPSPSPAFIINLALLMLVAKIQYGLGTCLRKSQNTTRERNFTRNAHVNSPIERPQAACNSTIIGLGLIVS